MKRGWGRSVIVMSALATLIALDALAPSPGGAQPATAEGEGSAGGQQTYAYFSPVAAPVPSLEGAGRRNDATRTVVAWLDLTGGPLVVSALDPGRHYIVPMLDRWASVLGSPGARISGTRADEFLVALSSWQGPLPAGIARIDSPTAHVWIIGHPEIDAPSDRDGGRRTPAGYRIAPLSEWAKQPGHISIDIASISKPLPRAPSGGCPATDASDADRRC